MKKQIDTLEKEVLRLILESQEVKNRPKTVKVHDVVVSDITFVGLDEKGKEFFANFTRLRFAKARLFKKELIKINISGESLKATKRTLQITPKGIKAFKSYEVKQYVPQTKINKPKKLTKTELEFLEKELEKAYENVVGKFVTWQNFTTKQTLIGRVKYATIESYHGALVYVIDVGHSLFRVRPDRCTISKTIPDWAAEEIALKRQRTYLSEQRAQEYEKRELKRLMNRKRSAAKMRALFPTPKKPRDRSMDGKLNLKNTGNYKNFIQ